MFLGRLLLPLAAVVAVAAQTVPPATVAPASVAKTSAPVDEGWTGCDPNSPNGLVKIGSLTTVCVVLASSTVWNNLNPATQYLRLSFQPVADDYSIFSVPNSYLDTVVSPATSVSDGTNNVTIHAASQKALSSQRLWFSPSEGGGKAYPYLSAIIEVNQGVVEKITWDDDCSLFCPDGTTCEENGYDFNGSPVEGKACAIEESKCSVSEALQPGLCDVKVGVVWTGTDADGNSLRSFSQSKYQDDTCNVDANVLVGARVANGNTQFVVPRRDTMSAALLPFDTAQLQPMSFSDATYYTTVADAGQQSACGTTGAYASGAARGGTAKWAAWYVVVVAALAGITSGGPSFTRGW